MKHLNQRNIKIVNELMSFCYKYNAKKMHIDVYEEESETIFKLSAEIFNLSENILSNVERLLNAPRSHEMEEYYWELTGDSDIDGELSLIGMMTDEASIDYSNNETLEIMLRRKK